MQQYLDLLRLLLDKGEVTTDRTGVGTRCIFGHEMRFDLSGGQLPMMTTKYVPFRVITEELLWFLRGDTKLRSLLRANVKIWTEWPFKYYLKSEGIPVPDVNGDEWNQLMEQFAKRILEDDEFDARYGDLGPVYGRQWRAWPTPGGGTIDQIQIALDQIVNTPDSRRIIVSAWNPAEIQEMTKAALPPCHCLFQFKVLNDRLSCKLTQRSCDTFLGVPFNIVSYALLTILMAHVTGLEPGELVWSGGDVHLYLDHEEQARLQLTRDPRPLPRVIIGPGVNDLFGITFGDLTLDGYNPHPAIKAPIAV